jgi:hypothetical protein
MVTCGCPAAAGPALDKAGAELELDAALDDDAAPDDGPEALLSLEQPAMPATIVAAPMAINSSRFTQFSLVGFDPRYRRILSSSADGRPVICCAYRR